MPAIASQVSTTNFVCEPLGVILCSRNMNLAWSLLLLISFRTVSRTSWAGGMEGCSSANAALAAKDNVASTAVNIMRIWLGSDFMACLHILDEHDPPTVVHVILSSADQFRSARLPVPMQVRYSHASRHARAASIEQGWIS